MHGIVTERDSTSDIHGDGPAWQADVARLKRTAKSAAPQAAPQTDTSDAEERLQAEIDALQVPLQQHDCRHTRSSVSQAVICCHNARPICNADGKFEATERGSKSWGRCAD
jgi:hypothetical protein